MKQPTANYDEPWKEALSEYFEAFLYFFFPEVNQLIDWTKTPESLEKELKRITASAKTKKRFADKLYKVWLLSGEEVWILHRCFQLIVSEFISSYFRLTLAQILADFFEIFDHLYSPAKTNDKSFVLICK